MQLDHKQEKIHQLLTQIDTLESNVIAADGPAEVSLPERDSIHCKSFDIKKSDALFEQLRVANQEIRKEGPLSLNAIMNDLNQLTEVMEMLE